jgi:dihydrofolate reductase
VHIHDWMFGLASWRERAGLEGGERNADDALVGSYFARSGAWVIGRRMFDEGEVAWPDPPPFRAPVFVPTHKAREPWVRKGGTTFTFVTDGIESALRQAKAAARGKDVLVSGGADVVQQFLEKGLVEEFTLHVAPLLLGSGVRLFDQGRPANLRLEQREVTHSSAVTHLTYRVVR